MRKNEKSRTAVEHESQRTVNMEADKIEPAYVSACTRRIPEADSPTKPSGDVKKNRGESSGYIVPDSLRKNDGGVGVPPRYILSSTIPSGVISPVRPPPERGFMPTPPPPLPHNYGSTEPTAPIFPKYPTSGYSDTSDDYEKYGWKRWQKIAVLVAVIFILIYSTSSFIVVMIQSGRTITNGHADSVCSSFGGTCLSILAERCNGGIFVPKYCSGTSLIQCCMKSTRCQERGGTCLKKSSNTCPLGYHLERNYCPGGDDFQCCIKSSKCTATGGKCMDIKEQECIGGIFVPGICSGISRIQCCFESKKCQERRGKCQDKNQTTCSGTFKQNICPGNNNIQCCRKI